MESFFSRYRNLLVLVAALLVQVIGLALQVRKPDPGAIAVRGPVAMGQDAKPVRLIRLWSSALVTPFERAIHGTTEGAANLWAGYIDLRHVHDDNRELQKTVDRLRLEQASLLEDARQGQRLQGLLKFQEGYIYSTVAAQVIGTSGSMQSNVLWLDKGADAGLQPDMAVITADGIVGKVRTVFEHTAQVLLVNDQTSGAGVVLETTRIRGILRGNAQGQLQVVNILADQRIQPGEHVLTAGGDQIFPRGLAVGTVEKVERDAERGSFINVIVKPAANLGHLDEVLVITSLDTKLSAQQQGDVNTSEDLKGAEVAAEAERKRAAEEMAERLPSLTDPNAPAPTDGKTADGTPGAVVPPPPAPKPIPAKHPDRFSPGVAGDSEGSAANGLAASTPVTETAGSAEPVTKPAGPVARPLAAGAKAGGSATKAGVPGSKHIATPKPGGKN
jgi:rod shape-determining protein MreC